MTADRPLPGLANDEELAAGRAVITCRECDRPLSGKAARMRGWGDGCAHKLGMRDVRGGGRFDVKQDGLPGV